MSEIKFEVVCIKDYMEVGSIYHKDKIYILQYLMIIMVL